MRRAAWTGWGALAAGAGVKGLRTSSVKQEGLRFLEQELETIDIPDVYGSKGPLYYNISE